VALTTPRRCLPRLCCEAMRVPSCLTGIIRVVVAACITIAWLQHTLRIRTTTFAAYILAGVDKYLETGLSGK